jgi:CheY-like chemotaxis protein
MLSQTKALIIEDTTVLRVVTRKWLEYAGYEVEEARNGQEGLNAMIAGSYDLVLCDADVPVLDGFECIAQLREYEQDQGRPRQFVLCVTDRNDDGDQELLAAGMDRVVRKPLKKASFDAILRSIAG